MATLTLQIDIDASAIDSALSDYPVRVSTAGLDSTNNASVFTEDSGSGADVWFSSDEAGSSPIDAKLLYWSDADSEFAFDVKVASLSSVSGATFYLQVGSKPGGYGTDPYDASTEGVWPLMDDFDDYTSNANDGTANGGVTAGGATGPDGVLPATDFDGVDDHITAPLPSGLSGSSGGTLATWVRHDSLNDFTNYVGTGTSGGEDRFVMGHGADSFDYNGSDDFTAGCETGTDSNISTDTNPNTTATWYHIAAVFDGTQPTDLEKLKIVVNGVEASTEVIGSTGFPTTLGTLTKDIYIGRAEGSSSYLDGLMAAPSTHSTARSAAWINADYLLQGPNASTYLTASGGGGTGDAVFRPIFTHLLAGAA